MCPPKAGARWVKTRKNKLNGLIVRQWNDKYSFPKGSMDLGETSDRAAQRELYEETGIELELYKFTEGTLIFDNIFYIFNCNDLEFEFNIDNIEITDIRWFPVDDLPMIKTNSYLKRLYFSKSYYQNVFENIH